jgi:uncharacterized protein with beta-barrel porin domain
MRFVDFRLNTAFSKMKCFLIWLPQTSGTITMKKINALSNKASLGTYLTLALGAGAGVGAGALGSQDAKAAIISSDLNETSVSMYNAPIGFSYSGGVIGVNSDTGGIYGISGLLPGKGMFSSRLGGNKISNDDPMNALISSGPLAHGNKISANTSWEAYVSLEQGLSNAYYGVRFYTSPDNYNYGWLEVSTPGTSVIFGTAAVETTANTSIGAGVTGVDPEPSNPNITNSGNQTVSGNTTNASLTVTGGTTVVTQGATATYTNQVTIASGVLDVNGTVVTPSTTVDTGSTLMGSGTLQLTGGNLAVNGTIAPGNSPGTFFVTGGNLVMGSTAVWDQQIYSTSVYDRVVVTGAAFLNGTMNITSYGSGGLEYGQKYNFLTASGGISGAFTSIIAPNGFRGRLLLSGNNTEANILIAPSSYTLLAQGKNQIQVASALDSFIPATSGDRLVIATSLDSLTASQYAQAFNAIMPTMYQSMATIAFNQANALNMQLNQRLWGVRLAEGGGFSMSGLADNYAMIQEGIGDGGKGVLDSKNDILCPGLDSHWGMFVDANGIFANANSANMLPGYSAQSGGITAGFSYQWNDSFASGLYCGYQGTYSKMGANGSGLGTGSSLIDNAVRFGVFGTYGHKDGKGLYVNALAGGAYHNYQATRVIQYTGVSRTASSTPGAGELDTMLATGYDIQKGKFTYGPTASLQYTYLGVNPVNETGAQSLNFNSGGWNSSSMLSSLGAHAAYNWQASKNVVVVPQISLNWQHEFLQNPYSISGNLGGTSPTFSNTSATGIRDYLYTGVGFTVEFNKKWNTSFFYNAAAGNSDLVSQNIFWSAGVKF